MKEYLTIRQLCECLHMSKSTAYRMIKDGMPAHYISTRKPIFNLEECIAWHKEPPRPRLTAWQKKCEVRAKGLESISKMMADQYRNAAGLGRLIK